ncbi:hypothetical protein SPRG_10752 [Saprolegnia parasitica CBS 223.65]|uniref:BTB domain-containing protein n=1 Tax=Saprolegnia parasitica (strain CBS 223.65) TaxID=695850 RepID=A0A067BYF3_SAPPC|nr:hypothetical protein SPRG_10752 [Saprolegnia parasitica CBS 223.65]KDO23559.1 hypothetical protein SPRG_10752 [Saprolegnia parasitica CBS 223.65]|eukprot:XP_012205709.1 hypothetical protein SPRG_10752 [Saprolegnia parasitica CBS 223.65]
MALYVWGKTCGMNDTTVSDKERSVYYPHFGGSVITDFAAGENHALAVTEFGDVYSWGRGNDGELGHGDRAALTTPQRIKGLEDQIVTNVACGNVHSVAATISGQVYMWGLLHDPDQPSEPTSSAASGMLHGLTPAAPIDTTLAPELTFFQRIVQDAESRFTEGENQVSDYEQGMNKVSLFRSRQTLPRLCTSLVGHVITKVVAGFGHSMAIDSCGQAYSCGYNEHGQLGLNHVRIMTEFTKIPAFAGSFVKDIACGQQHNLALVVSSPMLGSVAQCYTWGLGALGQLGHGTRRSLMEPELVTGLPEPIIGVAAGSHHSVAVDETGAVYTWGHSEYGQHGVAFNGRDLYDNRKYFVPVKHESLIDIVSVTCGSHFTLATDVHGVLHSWGWNAFGVLGTGFFQGYTLPQPLDHLRGLSLCHTRAGYNLCGAIVQYLGLPYAMGFRSLLASGACSDVSVALKDTVIPLHKVFLQARCPQLYGYIRAAIAYGDAPSGVEGLDLPGLDASILKALLTYLYADRLEVAPHKLAALRSVAEALGLTDLVARCVHHRKQRGQAAPEPSSVFSRDMATVVLDATDADVCFLWDGARLPAHKALLSTIPYFESMFSGRFRDVGDTVSLADMAGDGLDVDTFKRALHWLYTGDRTMLQTLDLDQVVELVVMANLLGIESLVNVCTLQLSALVANDPTDDLLALCWDVADRLDLQRLKSQCRVLLDAAK